MKRRNVLTTAGAAVGAWALPAVVRAQPVPVIKLGWAITPAQLPPIVFANPGVLRHYGKSYTVELVYFRGSAPQITAVVAGELQVAALAFSSFALAIQNARMTDIRVIGDLYQDGVEGYYSSQYVVRADSPVRSVADLRGKVIATNGIGGAVDMAMRKRMRDENMEDKRDYQVIEVQFPAMPAMLAEGKVDMAGMVAPFSLDEVSKGRVRPLFSIKDAMGVTQTTLMAARAPYVEKNRAALVDFMEDMQIGTRWLLDGKNREAALAVVARVTKRPVGDFAGWAFTRLDYFHDPAVRPNLVALQNNIRIQKELGFLRADIDVPKFADLSLVDEAAKRT